MNLVGYKFVIPSDPSWGKAEETNVSVIRSLSAAFLLSAILKMTGVWLAYPISECIVTMVGTAFYILAVHMNTNLDHL